MAKNNLWETNISAAKSAVQEMIKDWNAWKNAKDEKTKSQCLARYAAAFTNCKVFLENYLKHLYPDEQRMPSRVSQDIRNIVGDFDAIEKVDSKRLQKALKDIDQLSKDAA